MDILQKIEKFFESDEGKEYIEHQNHLEDLTKRNIRWIKNLSVERRTELIEKLKKKYDSDKYNLREYEKGYEPRTPLYYVLLEYAEACCRPSLYQVNEDFDEAQYDIDGIWVISIIFGQGCFVKVERVEDGRIIPHYSKDEEPETEIYYPNGELIIKTDDSYVIEDVLKQIGNRSGFYIIKDGVREDI